MDALRRGADIIVGTPGRVWAMTRRGALSVDHVSMLILDEADRLLDDSYEGAVNDICGLLPEKKQTLAFSATFSPWLRKLLQRLLTHPLYINVTPTSKDAENLSEDVAELRRAVLNGVRQQRVFLKEQGLNPKLAQLNAILQKHPFSLCIVFSNVKHHAAKIATFLRKHHYKACAINADVPQREREQAVKRVRQGALHVLIATDLLARGVDFDTCDLVVHLDVPEAPATYLHRVGRAGRYGRKGRSITLYDGAARGSVEALEAAIGMSIGVSPAEPACPQGRLGEDGKNRPPSKTMTEEAEGYNGNIREGNGASELHHREFETAAGVASDHTAKGSSRTLGNGPNKIAEHQEHTHVPPSGTHPPAPLNSPQQARTHAPGNSLNSSQKPSMLTKTPKPSPVKKRLLQLWNPHTKRMRLQPPNEASGQDRSNNDANTVAVSIDERVYAERRSPQAPLDRPARRVHSQAANGDIANAANEIDVEENSDVDDIRPVSPQPPDLQGLDPAYSTAGSPLHRNEQTARKSTAASDPPTQAEHIATERNTEGEEDPWDKIAADAYDAGYKEAYATAFKMATELQKRLDWASG